MSASGFAWQTGNWLVAVAIGVYIVGVTIYARSEARRSSRHRLLVGIIVMMLGIALLTQLPHYARLIMLPSQWRLFMLLMGLLIAWQSLRPIINPEPRRVQMAVKQSILSLVVLDAAVVLGVAGPIPAIVILSLLIPSIILARFIYST
jgi:4-hydroxybenzoate polyprenyltransferase